MELIIFLLIIYGTANIIVNETILEKIVEKIKKLNNFFDKLFSCTTCLSFYLGFFIYLMFNFTITGTIIDPIFAGLMASGFVNLIEHLKIKFM